MKARREQSGFCRLTSWLNAVSAAVVPGLLHCFGTYGNAIDPGGWQSDVEHESRDAQTAIYRRSVEEAERYTMMFAKHGLSRFMLSEAKMLVWFEPLPGEKIAMRIESGQTNNAFSLTEIVVVTQAGPPLHVHHDADEVLYVLEGTVDFVCDDERFRSGPGGLVVVPKGIPHAFRNFEIAPVRMLVMLSPGGFEQFMRAMNGRPPSEAAAVGAAYHMEIVGPQISALR